MNYELEITNYELSDLMPHSAFRIPTPEAPMSKIRGVIQLTAKPGFPKLNRQNGEQSVEMQYICSEEELANLPAEGDPFTDNDYPFFLTLPVTLKSCGVERQKNGEAYDVVLKYEAAPGDGGADAPVETEYDYDTQDTDVPVSALVNYRTHWNHDLLGRRTAIENGVISKETKPDFWAAATTNEIAPYDADTTAKEPPRYLWVPAHETPGEKYQRLFSATKPDTPAFMFGNRVINVIKRSSNINKLERDAAKDYSIETPPFTFDMPDEFLRGGSKITREGRLWVLRVAYTNIKEVDTDIYRVGLPPDVKPPNAG